jgi:hypothetical protein
MPDISYNLGQATGADDASYYNGVFTNTQTWHWIGKHNNAAVGPWSGYRFNLAPLAGIDINNITNVVLKMTSNNIAATGFDTNIVVEQTPSVQWANTTLNRPREREQANNDTTNPPVRWTVGSVAARVQYTSPDLSARVKAALGNGTWNYSTDRLGVLLGTPGGTAGTYITQMISFNSTVAAYRPVLAVTVTIASNSQTYNLTAVPSTSQTPAPFLYNRTLNISYHDGIGNSTRRLFNLYTPPGTAPVGGWPLVTWVHGGSYNGGNNVPPTAFIKACVQNGWAIAAPSYKVTNFNILLNTNIGWTHPHPVQDYICFLKHLATNASTYKINADKMVSTGESAGGHIAMESALLLRDSNRDTYPMAYQGYNTNRSAVYPYLNVTQGRTSLPVTQGIFSFAGPVDLQVVHSTTAVLPVAVSVYFGARPNDYFPTGINKESFINDYLLSTTGSVYDSRTPTAPDIPIAYAEHTDDRVVVPNGGLTPLRNALTAVGYDTTAANGTVNVNGLSYRSVTYGNATNAHPQIMSTQNIAFFVSWMTAVMAAL